jgi:hypothetical protein
MTGRLYDRSRNDVGDRGIDGLCCPHGRTESVISLGTVGGIRNQVTASFVYAHCTAATQMQARSLDALLHT